MLLLFCRTFVIQSIFATELFSGGQKRVNPRVVAVFHEQMRLEKSKNEFLQKPLYYTAR